MIPSQFYPTVSSDYFPTTGNTIEVTGDIRQQSDFADKYVYPYLMGYIKTSNIPVCFRISKVVFNTQDKTITAKYAEISDEYSDFMYSYPETNISSARTCMTIGTLPQYSYSIKCFNSLAPLQCYSKYYNNVISFETLYLDETEDSPVFSDTVTISTTSAQQTISFINGTGTINFNYRISGDSSDRTKALSLNDFDSENGVHKFTITENGIVHTIYIFIVNVKTNFTYYNDANGMSGATNYIVNATQATIHYIVDDSNDDNDYVITTQPTGGYRTYTVLEVARTGTGYSDILQDMEYTINGYSRLLHFELDNFVYGNLIQNPNVVFKNGNTFISYYRSLTSYVDFYIIRGWTPNDVRFYLALFPALSDGTESGRYLPRIVENELTGEFFNYYAIDYLGTEWQKSKEIADNEYKESDKPKSDEIEIDDTSIRNETTNLPELNGIRLVSGTGFCTFYLLSAYHVAEMGDLLSQMPSGFWESLGTATDYKMANILDYISSFKWYPINIIASAPSLYPDTPTNDVEFGFGGAKITFTATGTSYRLGTVNRVVDMGAVYIPYKNGKSRTYLDLEPYTDVYINLPYIGKVQLQANQVIGYTLSVHYVLDLITGLATCIVDNGYDTVYTGSGKIAVDITITGNDVITQSEQMTSAYVGTVNHAMSNALSLGGALAAKDAAGTASGTTDILSGIVADCIATANAKRGVPQVVGAGSGFGATYTCQYPAVVVTRPAVMIPAHYGHSTGYMLNRYMRIGDLSGYTVCSNPDLSGIAATADELDMIKNILCTGFYA